MLKNQNSIRQPRTPEQLAEFDEYRAVFGKGSHIAHQLMERIVTEEMTAEEANALLERNFEGTPEKNVAEWLVSLPGLLDAKSGERITPEAKQKIIASNRALTEMMLDTTSTMVTQQMVLDAAVRFAFASGIIDDGTDAEKLEHILRVQISGIHKEQSTVNLLHASGIAAQEASAEEDSTGTDVFIKLPGEAHNDYETWVEVDIKATSRGVQNKLYKTGAKSAKTTYVNARGSSEKLLAPAAHLPVIEVTHAGRQFLLVLSQKKEGPALFAAQDFRGNEPAIQAMQLALEEMATADRNKLTLYTKQEGQQNLTRLHTLQTAGALATNEAAK